MSTPVNSSTIIAAVATPPGRGGVGIIRVSGYPLQKIIAALLGFLPASRTAVYCDFLAADGSVIDKGIALYFPAALAHLHQ